MDAALAGDEIVVTNGIYATGGRAVGTKVLVNCVAAGKPLTLRSVNGPRFTMIQGSKATGGGQRDLAENGDGAPASAGRRWILHYCTPVICIGGSIMPGITLPEKVPSLTFR